MLACFARHVIVDQRSLIPLPDGVPADVAALIGCAVTTGLGAAIETLKLAAGSRGAVIGVGGVGINAVQGARLRGAAEVVAIDMSAARLQQAKVFGATDTVAADDVAKVSALRSQATTSGFDWAIVTVGREDAMRLGVEIVKPGGSVAAVGLMPEASPVPIDLLDMVVNEKKLFGSAYGSITPRVLIPRIVGLYLEGRLMLDELVSERLPLQEINRAFDLSRRAEGLRLILTLSDGGRFTD
jgi:S-(hydroxymethyl)glutathione dehydrogenase/alcohol dehydrogenase